MPEESRGWRRLCRASVRTAVPLGLGVLLAGVGAAFAVDPGNDYVRGVEIITKISPKDSKSFKDVYVECPPGKKAIGGGADVDSAAMGAFPNSTSLVALRTSQPSNGLLPIPQVESGPPSKGWQATAMETVATTQKWTLTAHVICANVAGTVPKERLLSDLETKKQRYPDSSPRIGGTVQWLVTVTNFGPDDDTGVVVTDTPDPPLNLNTAQSPGCTQANPGGPVTCVVGALAAGASKEFRIVFDIPADSPDFFWSNCATSKGDNVDPAGSNNEACSQAFVSE